jgi:hypothetical protein
MLGCVRHFAGHFTVNPSYLGRPLTVLSKPEIVGQPFSSVRYGRHSSSMALITLHRIYSMRAKQRAGN